MASPSVALVLALLVNAAAAGTNAFGTTFLAKMKGEPDVVSLPSGLMYRVLREGDGEEHPLADTTCACHYEGRTAQEYSKEPKGKKFDSSYDRGSTTSFAPSGVIKGWTEAMQLMVAGDKWEMFIPSELGYGDSGSGSDIGGGDVLVFTMEIVKLEGPGRPAEPKGPPPFTDLEGKVASFREVEAKGAPLVLAVLRHPVASSKLFLGFKQAARKAAKAEDGVQFTMTAASKFEKGKFTTDGLAADLKVSAPAVYTSAAGKLVKCKVGRPTEMTVEAIQVAISSCAATASAAKAEL